MDCKDTLEVISAFLAHPLIVVLMGGFVATLVGQRLTSSWESQRSALNQKYQMITDMTEEMAKLFSAANLAEVKRDSLPPYEVSNKLLQPIQDWTIFSEVFAAKLRAYYRIHTLADEWMIIYEAAYTFTHLSGLFDVDARQAHVDQLDYLLNLVNSRFKIDLELLVNRKTVKPGGDLEVPFSRSWRMTRLVIEEYRDRLAQRILSTRSVIELAGSSFFRRRKL